MIKTLWFYIIILYYYLCNDKPNFISHEVARWTNEHGQLHRTNGPAVIYRDGYKLWNLNGMIHRTDGPAVIFGKGKMEWVINDQNITKEVTEWMMENNIKYPFTKDNLLLFQLTFI